MTPHPDLSVVADMAFASACGHPGDKALDSTGLGLFCQTLTDCQNNTKAQLCSNIGDVTTYFCTYVCDPTVAGSCGAVGTCTCQGPGRCGCVPTLCLADH
jgi:hypothetical protein